MKVNFAELFEKVEQDTKVEKFEDRVMKFLNEEEVQKRIKEWLSKGYKQNEILYRLNKTLEQNVNESQKLKHLYGISRPNPVSGRLLSKVINQIKKETQTKKEKKEVKKIELKEPEQINSEINELAIVRQQKQPKKGFEE